MTDVLRTIGISKSFGGVRALSDVSLHLAQGAILGLIGPNGSGKTTLLNIITGVLQPDEGRAFVGDIDISGWRPDQISLLGISRTFQVARLFGALTVMENIELGVMAARRGDIDDRVTHLMDRFDLTEWASTRASALPYGVQRRLGLARAVGTQPRFLLLDEPAAGLNEEESDGLLGMIRDVRDDPELRCGILIIDHDLRLILRVCDSIHVLDEGRTIAEGTPQQVRRDPVVIESYLGKRYEHGEETESR